MKRSPLPFKLRAALLLPTLVAFAVSTPLVWLFVTGLIQRTAAAQLLSVLPLVEPHVVEALDEEDAAAAQKRVAALGRSTSLRITLIRDDGVVAADSDLTWDQVLAMDNHGTRPEVLGARDKGRSTSIRPSATTGLDYVYAARSIRDARGRPMTLRLAQPLGQLAAFERRLAQIVTLATTAALATLALLVWLYTRRLSEPAADLISGIRRLESGDFSVRLELPAERELSPATRFVNRFAARARERIGELETEIGHFKSLIAGISDGVLVTDAEGFTWLTNPAFSELFDVTGEVEGRTPLELTRDRRLEELIIRTLSRGTPQTEQIEIQLPVPRHVAIASTYLGEGSGAVVLARDVTKLVRLTEMRQDFVANVSHELTTPLSAIRGYAETLIDGAVQDERTAELFLARILQQCRRIQALLEDLLTLSRLESLEERTESRPVDLGDVVRDCLETVAQQMSERRIHLIVEAEADLPLVTGDREALERLVLNLLDNAVKYNREEGRITVRLSRVDGEVLLEVADSGLGIPSASLPRVFERFYRVDKARSREAGGTGLGLAIVKHAAQLHGGRVGVRSRIGEGSTFRVHLPIKGRDRLPDVEILGRSAPAGTEVEP